MIHTIIAISGASASGKSLFSQTIYTELLDELPPGSVAVISEDSYYRNQSHLPLSHREKANYDHPDALEHSLLKEHLQMLKAGKDVDIPVYDFSQHTRSEKTRKVTPPKVLIVEGILALTNKELLEEFDIKIFVDTPLDICLMRRMERDIEERGRSIQSVIKQYQETVRPMFFEFILPSKDNADIVITGGGKNRVAIDMIKAKIQHLLHINSLK